MMRVVSLLPSATEIVCRLGCATWLVGRSHECDYPPEVQWLPVCTEPAFEVEGTSAEIDRRVKERLRDALAVYRVRTDVLQALQPDVIVTQAQCDVCAVSLREVEQAVCATHGTDTRIVSLEPRRLGDVWRDVRRTAQVLGRPEQGAQVAAELESRVAAISTGTAAMERRPRVACLEWLDPLMAAGNWVPELVELAGGQPCFGVAGEHSPWLAWAELRAADPDVIVLMPCGFGIPRTLAELPVLTAHPYWATLRAVRAGRVFVVDGNQYFNRSGPRLVESLEIMAELLHPQMFHFGHAGSGWQPLP